MVKIYIPHEAVTDNNRKTLFILTRPFLTKEYVWKNDAANFKRWGINPDEYQLINSIDDADLVLIASPINDYFSKGMKKTLQDTNDSCSRLGIKAYGYISGDYGERYPEFANLIYFRMGGFKSQLNSNNKGFPVMITDRLKDLDFVPTSKEFIPTVGFCGHSTLSFKKRFLENIKFLKENLRRFIKNPLRSDYEPLFPSAYERANLLRSFEKSDKVKSNFIYRKRYRAGAITEENRMKTTEEYFENINSSDYVLCVRGGGNFSVRLY